jgi:transcription elongation factor Elf1
MTSHLKHYVDLSDFTSMRFECKHCGAALSFPFSVDMQNVPRVCPACNAEWVDMYSNRKPIEILKGFFDAYARVTRMLSAEAGPSPVGFDLHLELNPASSLDPASANRA